MTGSEIQQLFQKRVIESRCALEWSQAELARRMGVTPAYVCDYEKGRKTPNIKTVARFARALGVMPAALIDVGERMHV